VTPALLALVLLAAPEGTAASAGALSGVWGGPNGAQLQLTTDGAGKVVGTLVGKAGPCPLAEGTEVLHGTLLDDSLGAQVRLCLLSPSCGRDPSEALAILLVTRQLTGGVHTKAACAEGVTALVLRKPGTEVKIVAPEEGARLALTPPPPLAPAKEARAPAVKAWPSAPAAGERTLASNETRLPAQTEAQKAAAAQRDEIPVGQIPGRPVGGPHAPGYDPRDARNAQRPVRPVDALLSRGRDHLGTGEFEKARGLFLAALAKEPTRAEAYNGVGVSFYGRLDLEEALAWYKRALEADPQFGDAYYNIACAYALLDRKELAFRYLRLAALNGYFLGQGFEEDPDLDKLRGEPEMKALLAQMAEEEKADKTGKKPRKRSQRPAEAARP
jgi:tetratricopeptide (TPR) repeat protein